jgi:hypothetical protein
MSKYCAFFNHSYTFDYYYKHITTSKHIINKQIYEKKLLGEIEQHANNLKVIGLETLENNPVVTNSKRCYLCYETKDLSEFNNSNTHKDKKSWDCKECRKSVPFKKCHVCGIEWKCNMKLGHIRRCERNKYPNEKLNYVVLQKLQPIQFEQVTEIPPLKYCDCTNLSDILKVETIPEQVYEHVNIIEPLKIYS